MRESVGVSPVPIFAVDAQSPTCEPIGWLEPKAEIAHATGMELA
jgi:hypothetical protein